VAGYCENDNEP